MQLNCAMQGLCFRVTYSAFHIYTLEANITHTRHCVPAKTPLDLEILSLCQVRALCSCGECFSVNRPITVNQDTSSYTVVVDGFVKY